MALSTRIFPFLWKLIFMSTWKWIYVKMTLLMGSHFNSTESHFTKWLSQNESGFILQNENENVKMKMDSFHNETEMSSSSWRPKMTFAKWVRIHFAKWKWKHQNEFGFTKSHFYFAKWIENDFSAPTLKQKWVAGAIAQGF